MQPYKRRRRTRRDMIVLGGWLFADLLLGLAMLFAVANTVGAPPPTPTPTPSPDALATAEADFAAARAENQQTVEALEDQVAQAEDAERSAQQTQEAAQAAASETAAAEATRAALTEEERDAADAQATEDAIIAGATIAAFATEQALAETDADELNRQLAESALQATEIANAISAQSTEQAALAAIATENASSGANSLATIEALQGQIAANDSALATSQAQAGGAEATIAAIQSQSQSAQATSEAAQQQLQAANATSVALAEQVQLNSLSSESVQQTVQVDLGGVISGDEDARDDAIAALNEAFAPYINGQNCRIGFVNISSRAGDIGSGVRLSEAIGQLIEDEFPGLLPEPPGDSAPQLAYEAIALPGTSPAGEVQLQLFLSSGCQPAG